MRAAVGRFDQGNMDALQAILAEARPRDALTIWHLLSRIRLEQRGEVFDRFSELVTIPRGVTRQQIVDGEEPAIDAAWNALNLGDTGWWREWKRKW